jgi:hypothetical protein
VVDVSAAEQPQVAALDDLPVAAGVRRAAAAAAAAGREQRQAADERGVP